MAPWRLIGGVWVMVILHFPCLHAHFLFGTWIWWSVFKVGDLDCSFYWGKSESNLSWLQNLIFHYSSLLGFILAQQVYSSLYKSKQTLLICSVPLFLLFFESPLSDPLPLLRSCSPSRLYAGLFGKAAFKSFLILFLFQQSLPVIFLWWVLSLIYLAFIYCVVKLVCM
jgi:hypothetical protein